MNRIHYGKLSCKEKRRLKKQGYKWIKSLFHGVDRYFIYKPKKEV